MRDKITIPVELLSHVKKQELNKFINAYISLHTLNDEDDADLGEMVAKFFGITVYELKSGCKKADMTFARQIYMTILRMTTGKPLTKIGAIVNRNHATVLHAVKTVINDYEHDPRRRAIIKNLVNQLDDARKTVVFEALKERSYSRDTASAQWR